jgi:hypothetical protein
MNMAAEPTAPTMKAAEQSITMIVFKAFMAGLSISSRRVPDADGSWMTESSMMLRMMKSPKPSNDAKRRNMNLLAARQGCTNARTKAEAERKASSIPGRLSSMPTAVAAIASKTQIVRRINVLFLFLGVEIGALMIVSFLGNGYYSWLPNGADEPPPSAGRALAP